MTFRTLLLALCASIGGCASSGAPASSPSASGAAPSAAVRDIDVATLKADLDRGAVPLLLDVRTSGEFAGGHVPGAKNVPMDQLSAEALAGAAPDAEVYLICQSGGRSARAGAALAAQGRRVVNVTGGTAAWRAAGYPVE